jgi:hypothetical protein
MENITNANFESDITPNDLVENSDFKDKDFFTLRNDPSKVVRIESFQSLENKHDLKLSGEEIKEQGVILFNELVSDYEINVSTRVLSLEKEGEDQCVTITDKIEGNNLLESEIDDQFPDKVKALYLSLSRYYIDKYKKGEFYLWDLNSSDQYIYGNKVDQEDKDIFLIDTDIWFSRSKEGIFLTLYWLVRHMSTVESKLGIKFEEIRENLLLFLESVDIEDEYKDMVSSIDDYIKSGVDNFRADSAIPSFE